MNTDEEIDSGEKTSYKKTYKPLVLWVFLYIVGMIAFPVLVGRLDSINRYHTVMKLSLVLCFIGVDLLMFIIYKGEYVYWINGGPEYEEARRAPSENRKKYAKEHLDVFLKATIAVAVYFCISLMIHLSMWIDILVFTFLSILAAFWTMRIKFDPSI